MSVITVKYHDGVIRPDSRYFMTLLGRLSVIPMIVLGSEDVQIESLRMDSPIQQFVLGEHDSPYRAKDSSIVLNILHVHQEATPEDNNLVAIVALAAIWETLLLDWISDPNALVIQNGSASHGWAEGRPETGSSDILDAFLHGSLTREMARIKLEAMLGD